MNDRASTDNGALSDGYSLSDTHVESNSNFVGNSDRRLWHVIPALAVEGPFSYIVFALLPVVINDWDIPRHDIVADSEITATNRNAPSNNVRFPQ